MHDSHRRIKFAHTINLSEQAKIIEKNKMPLTEQSSWLLQLADIHDHFDTISKSIGLLEKQYLPVHATCLIGSSLWELFKNALFKGEGLTPATTITFKTEIFPEHATLKITDNGAPFSESALMRLADKKECATEFGYLVTGRPIDSDKRTHPSLEAKTDGTVKRVGGAGLGVSLMAARLLNTGAGCLYLSNTEEGWPCHFFTSTCAPTTCLEMSKQDRPTDPGGAASRLMTDVELTRLLAQLLTTWEAPGSQASPEPPPLIGIFQPPASPHPEPATPPTFRKVREATPATLFYTPAFRPSNPLPNVKPVSPPTLPEIQGVTSATPTFNWNPESECVDFGTYTEP